MNSLFGVCCKNFYVPWITGSWTRNYLCIFSLTYLSTVACAEDSNAVREEVWWEGRLLGKGSLRPPKAGNYSYRIALQRKKLRFPAVTNKANIYFSTVSLSWKQSIKGRRRCLWTAVFELFPGLILALPNSLLVAHPVPTTPHPQTKGMHEGFQWLCHNKGATIAGLAPPLGEGKQILALVLGLLRL